MVAVACSLSGRADFKVLPKLDENCAMTFLVTTGALGPLIQILVQIAVLLVAMDHIADDGEFQVNARKNLRLNTRGSGNTRTAPTKFLRADFRFLVFSERQVRFPLR